jgi:hypothetical protein
MSKTNFGNKEKWTIYTNIFFIIPILIGFYNKQTQIPLLLIAFLVSSTYYHIFRKPGAEWWWETKERSGPQTLSLLVEVILALILSLWGIVLLLQKPMIIFVVTIILFSFGFILFLSTNYEKYPLYHSVWHIISAITITIAIL